MQSSIEPDAREQILERRHAARHLMFVRDRRHWTTDLHAHSKIKGDAGRWFAERFLRTDIERVELSRLATEWIEGCIEDQRRGVRDAFELGTRLLRGNGIELIRDG